MTQSLYFSDRSEWDKLVVRTCFADEDAWWRVVAAMDQPWGGEFESTSFVVNDRAWEGGTVEQIRLAAAGDPNLPVVFIADEQTMTSDGHALLAVNVDTDEAIEFRIVANEASGVQTNLCLANMDYEEWVEAASNSADGVFRGF